jgi:hypothetical protein
VVLGLRFDIQVYIPREICFERVDTITGRGKLWQEMEVKGQTPSIILNKCRNLIIGGRRSRNVTSILLDVKPQYVK